MPKNRIPGESPGIWILGRQMQTSLGPWSAYHSLYFPRSSDACWGVGQEHVISNNCSCGFTAFLLGV